jgi:uncharacterized membrane protein
VVTTQGNEHRLARALEFGLLSAIVVLAVGLRFYKLGEWSFWGDEFITVRRASDLWSARSFSLLATFASLNVFGVSEWSARLPAAIIGVVSVPILFLAARQIFDPVVALLASLFLAISPWHIYWSQNARFYTALLLFYTLALAFFYWGLEKDRPWYLVLALVFLGFGMLERMVALFLVPVAVGYFAWLWLLPGFRPPGWRPRSLALFFGPGLVGAIVLILADPALRRPETFQQFFGFVNNNPLWLLAGIVFYLGLPIVVAAGAGAAQLFARNHRAGLLLILSAIIPPIAIMLISLFQYTANRYAFVSLTSIVMLAAAAAKDLLWQPVKATRIASLGFASILLLAPMADNFLYYRYQNGNRDNWKDAFALVSALKEDGDPVVTTHRELADYYMQQVTVDVQAIDVKKFVDGQPRVWFVLDLTAPDKAPRAYQWILANTQLVATLDVTVSARTYPMRIHLYDRQ